MPGTDVIDFPSLETELAAPMAEQELAAFFNSVRELFGSHQAEVAAEDWLHELTAIKGLPASARNGDTSLSTLRHGCASRVKTAHKAA